MCPAPPERFGDYELVERLGVGGMAETFVAIRRGPGGFEQRVCLKRILPTFVNDAEFVAMFLREARLSALLHHGHIARVLDFGIADGAHYLTLELIEGADLRAALRHLRLRGETLDPGLTSYVAYALASALDFAHTADDDGHAAGIIHRDVSPSNVLLSNAGEIKLSDFGIAKATNLPGSIQSGALKGKVPYMAPEYAIGRQCSARSDLFSLGVLLYECLAGFRPFDGGSDIQTLDRARNGEHELLCEAAPDAPTSLANAIESLLAPNPEDRPPNAATFITMLADVPPPPLAQRDLGVLVRSVEKHDTNPSMPGLASTRPAPTLRPRKRLPSRR
ncbi:MAG: serine/threonine protein kinase [Deltaproteobacteria bacterium]|nr:serine/threonine protein kinase [Deltaproteobacteria bacterium]MBW2211779.1 serine/threonine protein kinase [Deltaproteobacteria bacterium]